MALRMSSYRTTFSRSLSAAKTSRRSGRPSSTGGNAESTEYRGAVCERKRPRRRRAIVRKSSSKGSLVDERRGSGRQPGIRPVAVVRAASITQTWTPISHTPPIKAEPASTSRDRASRRTRSVARAEPVFDRRFARHDAPWWRTRTSPTPGQSVRHQVAAGDQDPGGNARRTDSILNDGGHGFRPLRALPRGCELERSAPPPLSRDHTTAECHALPPYRSESVILCSLGPRQYGPRSSRRPAPPMITVAPRRVNRRVPRTTRVRSGGDRCLVEKSCQVALRFQSVADDVLVRRSGNSFSANECFCPYVDAFDAHSGSCCSFVVHRRRHLMPAGAPVALKQGEEEGPSRRPGRRRARGCRGGPPRPVRVGPYADPQWR